MRVTSTKSTGNSDITKLDVFHTQIKRSLQNSMGAPKPTMFCHEYFECDICTVTYFKFEFAYVLLEYSVRYTFVYWAYIGNAIMLTFPYKQWNLHVEG